MILGKFCKVSDHLVKFGKILAENRTELEESWKKVRFCRTLRTVFFQLCRIPAYYSLLQPITAYPSLFQPICKVHHVRNVHNVQRVHDVHNVHNVQIFQNIHKFHSEILALLNFIKNTILSLGLDNVHNVPFVQSNHSGLYEAY